MKVKDPKLVSELGWECREKLQLQDASSQSSKNYFQWCQADLWSTNSLSKAQIGSGLFRLCFKILLIRGVSSALLTPFSHIKCFQYPLITKIFTNIASMTCKQRYDGIWEVITYFPDFLPLVLDLLEQNRRCKLWYLNSGLLDFFFSLILLLSLWVTELNPFKDKLNIAPNID